MARVLFAMLHMGGMVGTDGVRGRLYDEFYLFLGLVWRRYLRMIYPEMCCYVLTSPKTNVARNTMQWYLCNMNLDGE